MICSFFCHKYPPEREEGWRRWYPVIYFQSVDPQLECKTVILCLITTRHTKAGDEAGQIEISQIFYNNKDALISGLGWDGHSLRDPHTSPGLALVGPGHGQLLHPPPGCFHRGLPPAVLLLWSKLDLVLQENLEARRSEREVTLLNRPPWGRTWTLLLSAGSQSPW